VDYLLEGKGVFTWADGNRYEGDFVGNKRTGKGTFSWANGNRYTGDFVEGKRTGKGVMTWANGQQQEGDFLDGKPVWTVAMKWINDPQTDAATLGHDLTGAKSPVATCLVVPPDYPAAAGPFPGWDGLITGQVKAQVLVENGVVQSVQIQSGPKIFHDVVRAAMLQYKCPGVIGPVSFKQEFNFASP
jgi:hypothetical protein